MKSEKQIREYFDQPDTPALNSPVGAMMRRILEEEPGLSWDKAREMANLQIQKAAARKTFSPETPKQERDRREKTANYFRGNLERAKNTPSGEHHGPETCG